MKKLVVELFAGVGGFRLGLEHASKDFKFVWANQWEPSRIAQDAYNCYVSRFGNDDIHSNENIYLVEKEEIPDHTLLVTGFPCLEYCVENTGVHGMDMRGVPWWHIYDIVNIKKPPFILLENVDRLLEDPVVRRGRAFGIILATLNMLDYSVEWRVVNAADFGFAQRRRRVFIFAYRNDTKYAKKLLNFSNEELVLSKGLYNKCFPASSRVDRRICNDIDVRYSDLVKFANEFESTFWNSGIMRNGIAYSEDLLANPVDNYLTLEDILEKNVDEKYYLDSNLSDWEYLKGSKRIERTHRDGHKYVFAEGKVAFPDHIDRPARAILRSEASKNRSTHIIRDPENGKLRKLTPVECERLNGFPDDWTNTGMSEQFRYFCMGNAVVVDIVKIIGQRLDAIISDES